MHTVETVSDLEGPVGVWVRYFDSLRAELAPANIGVTAIFPG